MAASSLPVEDCCVEVGRSGWQYDVVEAHKLCKNSDLGVLRPAHTAQHKVGQKVWMGVKGDMGGMAATTAHRCLILRVLRPACTAQHKEENSKDMGIKASTVV